MHFINFSTNTHICSNLGKLYIIIYSYYMGSKNFHNNLQDPPLNYIKTIDNLRLFSQNFQSEKTFPLFDDAEKEVYDFINDWSDILYDVSQKIIYHTLEETDLRYLRFCENIFQSMYFDIINFVLNLDNYGEPFFNLKDLYTELQNCVFTIFFKLQDYNKIENFIDILIELKLIAVIFTKCKYAVLNKKFPIPT